MPFTISHAVLAPPIAKLTGYRLPIAALAIGTMTPDLYRLFTTADYNFTHQWQSLIFPNLFIALGFCLLWYCLYRPVVFRLIGLKKPLNLNSLDKTIEFLLSLIIATIVGIATHLIWDGLTHSDFRTFAFEDFLNSPVYFWGYSYPMHRVLQIGSSVLALPFLFWMSVHYYFKYKQNQPINNQIKVYALLLFLITGLSGTVSYFHFSQQVQSNPMVNDLYWYLGKSINQFTQAALISFSFGCLIFLFLDRKHRLG
ncbi:DUF4184 family protein [Acinetobacter sp. ANC 4648]|uniref:DUF4184 family protein n=1 Tax=Acinetobacter sp. ANC 4648 TaxID=1977875 RepID=UPI000A33CF7F|nr:DUF4184 family protein [Acinetobacter sp. ANC 4648]OTG84711.1 phospholipase [Acinetobacter sp. ANC 4648]